MRIIECHFEFSGFDDRLVKAGTPVYLWNLSREFLAAGHSVGAVTAAHGLLPYLRERHEVTDLDWRLDEQVPVALDPLVWPGFPERVTLRVSARAHRLTVGGVDVVVLSGGMLDEHRDTFYPPAALEGTDLSFLKPLVFQVAAARYLADTAAPGTVVHLHEPVLHHVLPAALDGRGLLTVSTVQTNLPVNTKVYGPQVRALVEHLGGDPGVTGGLADPPLDSPLERAMRSLLPDTLLYEEYRERPGHDYVSVLGLVIRSVCALDFLSHGQLEHALTQAETPFEQLFGELAVRRELFAGADRLVVGGCAIGDAWLDVTRTASGRRATLTGLDLDPDLPTIYHNGRYAVEHKGLREMLRALLRLLDEGERCNVLLHLLVSRPPQDAELAALAARHGDRVRISTEPMTPEDLVAWASASDLSVFTAKFERDTFLMAMGEAMAAGAVPVATAQRGMRHFGHTADLDDPAATGLALARSFRVDDPVLADAAHRGLRRMLALVREEPERVERLRSRGVEVARRFTWSRVARRFLTVFQACADGTLPVPDEARGRLPRVDVNRSGERAERLRRHARARAEGDTAVVTWQGPPVARVEAVRAGAPARPWRREGVAAVDGPLTARVPLTDGPVILLVTLPDGCGVWLEVPVREDAPAGV